MQEKNAFIDRFLKGMTYSEFYDKSRNKLLLAENNEITIDTDTLNYTKLNIKRSERIDKTYKAGDVLKNKVKAISAKQIWMIITEDWCGDSAQNIPYIAKMAAENDFITLRILERDSNPDIMDMYLTNGTKSIPILAAFSESGEEIFRWGPRPKEAADLVKKAKDEGKQKDQFIEELHLWYGRNKGAAIEKEFISLLS